MTVHAVVASNQAILTPSLKNSEDNNEDLNRLALCREELIKSLLQLKGLTDKMRSGYFIEDRISLSLQEINKTLS